MAIFNSYVSHYQRVTHFNFRRNAARHQALSQPWRAPCRPNRPSRSGPVSWQPWRRPRGDIWGIGQNLSVWLGNNHPAPAMTVRVPSGWQNWPPVLWFGMDLGSYWAFIWAMKLGDWAIENGPLEANLLVLSKNDGKHFSWRPRKRCEMSCRTPCWLLQECQQDFQLHREAAQQDWHREAVECGWHREATEQDGLWEARAVPVSGYRTEYKNWL